VVTSAVYEITYLPDTPTANLTTFQNGPFYFGIKVFNHLPTALKIHHVT